MLLNKRRLATTTQWVNILGRSDICYWALESHSNSAVWNNHFLFNSVTKFKKKTTSNLFSMTKMIKTKGIVLLSYKMFGLKIILENLMFEWIIKIILLISCIFYVLFIVFANTWGVSALSSHCFLESWMGTVVFGFALFCFVWQLFWESVLQACMRII